MYILLYTIINFVSMWKADKYYTVSLVGIYPRALCQKGIYILFRFTPTKSQAPFPLLVEQTIFFTLTRENKCECVPLVRVCVCGDR